MPVAPITYVYLTLMIASFLFAILSAFHRNWEKFVMFLMFILLFGIGFSSNYQVCPMFFCIGQQ
jgi:hypothetical protein